MNIVNDFKIYLVSQKKPAGDLTIKNYLADVKKFITWYESTYKVSFEPNNFTKQVLAQYQNTIQTYHSQPSLSSVKRYFSSLRKLATFLVEAQLIATNPLVENEKKQKIYDPFYLKSFKNFLSSNRASKLTVKNYINDIKQFLAWLEIVSSNSAEAKSSSLLEMIDNKVLHEYKMRLLKEANLSPVSINRKLSSLRRYLRWLEERKILSPIEIKEPAQNIEVKSVFNKLPPARQDIPLQALQGLEKTKQESKDESYSNFAPLRLGQKSVKTINLGLDLLIFNPLANTVGSLQYLFWKNRKKVIFAPVIDILDKTSYVPQGFTIKTIIPKQVNIIPPRSANLRTVLQKVLEYNISEKPRSVSNFTKALYAPMEISTKQMHWTKKIWHNMLYNRPKWYKAYHSYSFVSYLHLAIMIIATTIASSALYQTWRSGNGMQNQAVLAAQDISPPRTLTFQGRLLTNTNTPITVETPLRFALYNSPMATGAAKLWAEKQDIKPDQNGNFSTTLGLKTRLDQHLFNDYASLYIGIAIGDKQELLPRQQIPTSQYAADSQSVEGLKPITDNQDKTQNVLLALDSSGNLTIGGSASPTFQATGGKFSLSGESLLLTTNPSSNGNIKIAPDGSGIIDLQKPIQNTSNSINRSGILGAVEVEDILSVLASTSSQSALVINQIGSGDIISGRSNGIDKFRLDNSGNTFIGGNLILKGDTIDSNSTSFVIGGDSVNHLTIGSKATVLSLGNTVGVTSIRNNLSIQGLITANGGVTIPQGQTLALANFIPGAIPFIGGNSQIMQDASRFSWNDNNKTFNVLGSVCINSVAGGSCDSTDGTITAKTLNTTGTADLAENYVSSENLEAGDVVAAEGGSNDMAIVKSTIPYERTLIGIVSTNPGVTLNSNASPDYEHPNVYPLALQGRVPVKVSNINGPIQPGDELTSSSIPGVAMLASSSGQVIGKALDPYTNNNPQAIGKIMAFINLSYYSSPTTIINGDVVFDSKKYAQQAEKPQTNNPLTASDSANQVSASTDSKTASTSASSFYNSNASQSATASSGATLEQTPTPTPSVPTGYNGLETDANLPNNFASLSQTEGQLTYVPNFKSDYATFNDGLIALGPSSLTDVAVSDMVIVHNNLKITSDSLDTIASDLNIQPLRQGNILFQGGLVAIDTQGNLKVNGNAIFNQNLTVNGQLATGVIAPIPNQDLRINLKNNAGKSSNMVVDNASGNHIVQINQQGDIIASGQASFSSIASQGFTIIRGAEADASNTITVADGSGGKGIISAHQTERTIITPYVTSHSLIYVSATSNTGSSLPYVARQTPEDPQAGTKGSFSVAIPNAVNHDITFNWWIVN